jgi:hypothetical protein
MKTRLFSSIRVHFVALALVAGSAYPQSPYVLVIRENGERVELLFEGTHALEGATSIDGPWTNLGSHAAPYTDPDSATFTQRFYRMNDGGACSSNAVGYYRLSLCRGFSLIANQLNAPDGNTVANLFKSPPEGTVIYKFNPANGGYVSISLLGGTWEGDDLEMTLHPGEGAWVVAPMTFTNIFLGDVRSVASVPLRSGFSIISYPFPRSGSVEGFPPGGLNLPAHNGDETYQFDRVSGGYRASQYYEGFGWWGGGDCGEETPCPPFISLGEAFWLNRTFAPPGNWTGTYSVCP